MRWGEWFRALAGVLTRPRARRRGRRGEEDATSLTADRRELQQLHGRLEALRARRREADAAFQARHALVEEFPRDGGLSRPEVERRLADLRQIREERLRAEEEACERRIRELERRIDTGSDQP